MAKRKKGPNINGPKAEGNPVAKNMHKFCKATVTEDKTKYSRKEKYKGSRLDPFSLTYLSSFFLLELT